MRCHPFRFIWHVFGFIFCQCYCGYRLKYHFNKYAFTVIITKPDWKVHSIQSLFNDIHMHTNCSLNIHHDIQIVENVPTMHGLKCDSKNKWKLLSYIWVNAVIWHTYISTVKLNYNPRLYWATQFRCFQLSIWYSSWNHSNVCLFPLRCDSSISLVSANDTITYKTTKTTLYCWIDNIVIILITCVGWHSLHRNESNSWIKFNLKCLLHD